MTSRKMPADGDLGGDKLRAKRRTKATAPRARTTPPAAPPAAKKRARPSRARSRDWKPTFLTALRETRSAAAAAERAGISRQSAYEHRQKDPEFAAAWATVDESITDDLEQEAVRRATDGVSEPVFYQGKEVGQVRRYSDSLLQFLLRGRRRDVYGDRTEITGQGGGPIAILALSDLARETGVAGELEQGGSS